ncbi:MAG: glycerophosphodiester phosphodiesterase family protein [Candidatus Thorarchaeota archaeon]
MTEFDIIGHRGASGHAPENTMKSFTLAKDLGATMIELDVHETSDSYLVCIHDWEVSRTTNGEGYVGATTLDELRNLDAGEGEKIPLLEDVLRFCQGQLRVNVELKAPDIEQNVLGVVERVGMLSSVVFTSSNQESLRLLKQISRNAATGIIIVQQPENIVDYAQDIGVSTVNPEHVLVSREMIEELHASEILVHPWTVNDEESIKRLVSIGVDGIISDYPDIVKRVLDTTL